MRIHLAIVAATTLLASTAAAQAAGAPQDTSPIGTWRGTSICLVRNSPCHDESTVYRITRAGGGDSVAVDALKIVGGQEESMGVLACGVTAPDMATVVVRCAMRNGVWSFRVRGDSLVGELRLPDGSKFRDVRATRAR